jgi:hypothetical protein
MLTVKILVKKSLRQKSLAEKNCSQIYAFVKDFFAARKIFCFLRWPIQSKIQSERKIRTKNSRKNRQETCTAKKGSGVFVGKEVLQFLYSGLHARTIFMSPESVLRLHKFDRTCEFGEEKNSCYSVSKSKQKQSWRHHIFLPRKNCWKKPKEHFRKFQPTIFFTTA